ncbi:unnamed protein product [Prorocentrum cordatum]|uniref:Uncharacterized protein n=1 Tax=Prorocentrum cordatum TaxID=2364126 RepID=A0ABN9XY17_9DINO|nr:unnamed protein product [Polarella glacialis]
MVSAPETGEPMGDPTMELVKALLVAAYPQNLALRRRINMAKHNTATGLDAIITPQSVNAPPKAKASTAGAPTGGDRREPSWWSYGSMQISNRQGFLRATTLIDPYHVALFGGLHHEQDQHGALREVDGWIELRGQRSTLRVLARLRDAMSRCIHLKALEPGRGLPEGQRTVLRELATLLKAAAPRQARIASLLPEAPTAEVEKPPPPSERPKGAREKGGREKGGGKARGKGDTSWSQDGGAGGWDSWQGGSSGSRGGAAGSDKGRGRSKGGRGGWDASGWDGWGSAGGWDAGGGWDSSGGWGAEAPPPGVGLRCSSGRGGKERLAPFRRLGGAAAVAAGSGDGRLEKAGVAEAAADMGDLAAGGAVDEMVANCAARGSDQRAMDPRPLWKALFHDLIAKPHSILGAFRWRRETFPATEPSINDFANFAKVTTFNGGGGGVEEFYINWLVTTEGFTTRLSTALKKKVGLKSEVLGCNIQSARGLQRRVYGSYKLNAGGGYIKSIEFCSGGKVDVSEKKISDGCDLIQNWSHWRASREQIPPPPSRMARSGRGCLARNESQRKVCSVAVGAAKHGAPSAAFGAPGFGASLAIELRCFARKRQCQQRLHWARRDVNTSCASTLGRGLLRRPVASVSSPSGCAMGAWTSRHCSTLAPVGVAPTARVVARLLKEMCPRGVKARVEHFLGAAMQAPKLQAISARAPAAISLRLEAGAPEARESAPAALADDRQARRRDAFDAAGGAEAVNQLAARVGNCRCASANQAEWFLSADEGMARAMPVQNVEVVGAKGKANRAESGPSETQSRRQSTELGGHFFFKFDAQWIGLWQHRSTWRLLRISMEFCPNGFAGFNALERFFGLNVDKMPDHAHGCNRDFDMGINRMGLEGFGMITAVVRKHSFHEAVDERLGSTTPETCP